MLGVMSYLKIKKKSSIVKKIWLGISHLYIIYWLTLVLSLGLLKSKICIYSTSFSMDNDMIFAPRLRFGTSLYKICFLTIKDLFLAFCFVIVDISSIILRTFLCNKSDLCSLWGWIWWCRLILILLFLDFEKEKKKNR